MYINNANTLAKSLLWGVVMVTMHRLLVFMQKVDIRLLMPCDGSKRGNRVMATTPSQ